MKKKVCVIVCCLSLFSAGFCIDDAEVAQEKKEKEEKIVSDVKAVTESIFAGISMGVLFYVIANKFKFSGFARGGVAGGGFLAGFIVDQNKGYFPRYTSSAYVKAAISVLQGNVSDPELLKKIGELTQECAIKFIKELIKNYGADGAENALEGLKKEVRRGYDYLEKANRADLKKRGRIFSAKNNLDKYEKRKKKLEDNLEKIEQTQHMVNFKRCFDEHAANIQKAKVLRAKYGPSPVCAAGHCERKLEWLKKQKKKLPFACVQEEEFERLEEETHRVIELLKKEDDKGLADLVG